MQITVSKWGNSLAVRIPVEVARQLNLAEGAKVECSISEAGAFELKPMITQVEADREWLQEHFARVNRRLAKSKLTTPAHELLKDEERY
jgi:antitoxin MazE